MTTENMYLQMNTNLTDNYRVFITIQVGKYHIWRSFIPKMFIFNRVILVHK